MIRPMRQVMILSLVWAGMVQVPAFADVINFTGDVENDFALTNQSVIRVLDFNGQTGDVAQAQAELKLIPCLARISPLRQLVA